MILLITEKKIRPMLLEFLKTLRTGESKMSEEPIESMKVLKTARARAATNPSPHWVLHAMFVIHVTSKSVERGKLFGTDVAELGSANGSVDFNI